MIKDDASCNANTADNCSWMKYESKPRQVPSSETPLFTKEFCHPEKLTSDFAAEFPTCFNLDTIALCASEAGRECKWSNGTALIPDRDFCAPADITDNVDTIKMCVSKDTETNCDVPECKWRRGKQAPIALPTDDSTNDQTDLTGEFFSKNFCHPSMTDKGEYGNNFTTKVVACLKEDNK
jgi:hypothetical protein